MIFSDAISICMTNAWALIGNFLVENLSDVPAGNRIQLKLKLDLNGMLIVTAEELDTGLIKTVRMETSSETEQFNLKKAQQNISSISMEEEFENESLFSSADKTDNNEILMQAKSLRKRAESPLNSVDEVDANEITDLLNKSKTAIIEKDMTELDEINNSLSDMLFYLED